MAQPDLIPRFGEAAAHPAYMATADGRCYWCTRHVPFDKMHLCTGCGRKGCFGCTGFGTLICQRCAAWHAHTVKEIRNQAGRDICEMYDVAVHATDFKTAKQLASEYEVAREIGILIRRHGEDFLVRNDFHTAAKLSVALCMRDLKEVPHSRQAGIKTFCRSCLSPVLQDLLSQDKDCSVCQDYFKALMRLHFDIHSSKSMPGISSSSVGN